MPPTCLKPVKRKQFETQCLTTAYRALWNLAPACFHNPILPLVPTHFISFFSALDISLAPAGHRAFGHAVLITWNAAPAPPILASGCSSNVTSPRSWLSPPCLCRSCELTSLSLACLPFLNLFVRLLDKCLTSSQDCGSCGSVTFVHHEPSGLSCMTDLPLTLAPR